jgi:LCP family protein required for cell wall assembly
VGSDSRDCIDPNSPYAGAFLAQGDVGERPDTIMVLRVDPEQTQAALVSFPRDLWVKIGDTNRKSRINSAYDREDPTKLVATIQNNFGIPVDHYLEVDFCAFKYLVDAVGGVNVPFTFPTKDRYTGLNIEAPGCYRLSGDEALAYVRSRHYQYFEDGKWKTDGTSDRGRIARQQDFIRRALQRAVDRGATRPDIAKGLLDAVLPRVRIDTELRIADVLAVASKLRGFDPNAILSYRLDGRGTVIGGASVFVPDLTNDSTEAILKVFRGEALLADAPDPDALGTVPDDPTATSGGGTASTVAGQVGLGDAGAVPPTEVVVEENAVGISPPDDPTCR